MKISQTRLIVITLLIILFAVLAYLLGPDMAVVLVLPLGVILELYWAFGRGRR